MTVAPGDTTKLTYTWKGEPSDHPVNGDVLLTSTGRRYLILCARGRRIEDGHTVTGAKFGWGTVTKLLGPMRLEVVVMAEGDEAAEDARTFDFKWDKRKKR